MTANVSQGRATKIFCQRRSAGSNLKVFVENEEVRRQKNMRCTTLHDQIVCTLGKPTLPTPSLHGSQWGSITSQAPSCCRVRARPERYWKIGLNFGRLCILDPDVARRLDLSSGNHKLLSCVISGFLLRTSQICNNFQTSLKCEASGNEGFLMVSVTCHKLIHSSQHSTPHHRTYWVCHVWIFRRKVPDCLRPNLNILPQVWK